MNGELSGYALFFHAGQWVGVDIPLTDGRIFQVKALIQSLDHDLVVLHMSRDLHPEGACFHVGATFEIKLGRGLSGFRCRAIIVEENNGVLVPMRLVGDVISNDLREYFRIDIAIPLKYSIPALQDVDAAKDAWQEKQGRVEAVAAGDSIPPSLQDDFTGLDPLPVVANLSGGGLRIRIFERLNPDTLVDLSLYLPSSASRVIDVVGQVVYVNPIYLSNGTVDRYDTAMRYLFIDEKDRDAIIRYIFTVQTQQIAQIRETASDGLLSRKHDQMPNSKKMLLLSIGLAIALLAAIIALLLQR